MLEESGSGYTLIWKGKDNGKRRIHGVGFVIKTSIYWNHQLTPTAISKRLMTIFSSFNTFMALISAYAPTLDADEETKNQFYQQLNELFLWTPPQDKLLLCDFNARVGKDHRLWNNIVKGVRNCNANSYLLLDICIEHNLAVTNTMFRLPNWFKTTWQHPRSKHWRMMDYAIVHHRDRSDVCITKAVLGAGLPDWVLFHPIGLFFGWILWVFKLKLK